ncbi:ribonuclease H2, subunit C [Rhexocercosporidium sp. MPI-PUGE-AT-0058]|nr:ribonuclease H2, subunit C [Rhexocercosporidium sp. MPI-PUGE-AT-0058]
MLALEKSKSHRGKCTPNVLPCRINHNGAVNTSKRYWNPSAQPDGKRVAYFRGRKLHGKTLKIPSKYRGVVVEKTERVLPKVEGTAMQGDGAEGEGDEEEDAEVEVKIMEEQAGFEEIVVWGHEVLPDGMADPYVRGVEDWITFAESIHSFDVDEKKV